MTAASDVTDVISIALEVAEALAAGRPVVALETTIVSHGMPWPQNFETAQAVEELVRENGAVPAAIAVIGGRIKVGLTTDELQDLSRAKDVLKLTTADLAYGLISGRTGGTTVAATMVAPRLAGIDVFCTGGIGGVHRGAETSFDISADMTELGRTDVVVVSAGPKALLDIPKTLEYLETEGVPVVAYRSDEVPAFWSRSSGLPAPIRLDTPSEIATFVATRASLGLAGGLLITNPVPEADEIPAAEMQPIVAEAIRDAGAAGVRAKAVTPWLLDRILQITEGRSLVTNIALVKNNARLAAAIAGELSATRR